MHRRWKVMFALVAACFTVGPSFASTAGATTTVPATRAIPFDANPQDHCNGVVCVGAESVDGDGSDIIAAQVETRGLFSVAVGTVFYLNYGANPTNAKQRIPFAYCIAESNNVSGCSFYVGQTLNVGWVLCGQIVNYVGYPCITIGPEDD